jgi:hypothetical protein
MILASLVRFGRPRRDRCDQDAGYGFFTANISVAIIVYQGWIRAPAPRGQARSTRHQG